MASALLTVERIRSLMAEADGLQIDRTSCPPPRDHFVMQVARRGFVVDPDDPPAKSLGDFLRSRLVDVPRTSKGAW